MPKKTIEHGKLPKGWSPPKFYLNGEPVDKIPEEVKNVWAERLSRVVSQHFREHPDEYERFLKGREQQKQEALT